MGYPNFGKVKTITLPIPSTYMTYKQYKEKYGIDLKNILFIDEVSKLIKLKPSRTLLLADISEVIKQEGIDYYPAIISLGGCAVGAQDYISGSQNALLIFTLDEYTISDSSMTPKYELKFQIESSDSFEFDNIIIGYSEI